MSLVKEGLVGGFSKNVERNLRNQLIQRWKHVGGVFENNSSSKLKLNENGEPINEGRDLLEGLDKKDELTYAILYENTATALLSESTNSSSSGSFEVVAFPMVRRIFSRLLTNEIVSIQAMTQPSGQLFYFYPKISDRVETTSDNVDYQSHTSPFAQNLATCVGANCPDTTYSTNKSLYDAYYDDALFDHSKGTFTIYASTGYPVVWNEDGELTQYTGATLPVNSETGTVDKVMYAVAGFNGVNAGTSKGHTARLGGVGGKGLEIDTEEFLTSFLVTNLGDAIVDPSGNTIFASGAVVDEGRVRLIAQEYGKSIVDYLDYCNATGTLYLEIDFRRFREQAGSSEEFIGAASGTTIASSGLAFTWRRYDDLEASTEMGEVSFEIRKVTVSATPRKLRARWTPELAQDVEAYHNIDAEAELTALLSEQIAMEIDREVLRDLKRGAAWKLRWNFRGWKYEGSQKYTEKEWKQTLVTKVNQISAQIHKSTLRGGANFLVVSSEVSAIFDDLEAFAVSNAAPAEDQYNLGMRKMGSLNGRYTVYVDPYAPAGDILIGHKGTSILDTGYIYAPYVPVELTPTLQDFNNFTYVKGIQTRYAKKMVNNRYFGKITVANIPTFDTTELR